MFLPLYIDPGTGSMLFSLAIGIVTAVVFGFRAIWIKLRFWFNGGKNEKQNLKKIPIVIYSDHKRYWNVFKPICDEFEKRKISVVYYTQSSDDPVFTVPYEFIKSEFIGEGNKGFVKMNMLNASVVLSTTPGLDVLQWKRSKLVNKYIHIPHSCDDLSVYRMFALDYYDAFLTCGQNQVDVARKIETLRPKANRKDIQIAGCTYLDAAKEYIKKLDVIEHKKEDPVVLLAPSWGKNAILSRYGEKLIDSLIATGFKIIIRPHPQSFTAEKDLMNRLIQKYNNLEWNRDNDNLKVLNRADIMITDFSGIIFDWSLLFDKPCIVAENDLDTSVMDAAWLDEKPWILNAVERLGLSLKESDFNNMKQVISDALSSNELSAEREKVKKECWANIGNSASTIVDYVMKEFE